MKRAYITKNFRAESTRLINIANDIIDEYAAQGFDLTLRQLYYQCVARGHIPNTQKSYKNFGSLIDDGRLAGLVDWNRIVDRTRNLQSLSHWSSPADIIDSAAQSYHIDRWATQHYRPYVLFEKEALSGVIAQPCRILDVPYFACRGYTSQSEMWAMGQRFIGHINNRQEPIVFYLGDHDPSGVDMGRDVLDRLRLFVGRPIEVRRLALNMDQVEQYNPPPNPAKVTDSRFEAYADEYGDESWELDALEPTTLAELIEAEVLSVRNDRRMTDATNLEEAGRTQLVKAAQRWSEVARFLEDKDEEDK